MGRKKIYFEEYTVQNVPQSIAKEIKAICEKWGKLDEKQKAKTLKKLSEVAD